MKEPGERAFVSRRTLTFAGVDVGSNSVLLTIARPGPDGRLIVLDERCVITRLGQGLSEGGRLSHEASRRTLAVLEEFGAAIVALGARARAAGTSALRRADDAEAFLDRATEVLGFPLELLSGADEARLGWRGATSDLRDRGITPEVQAILIDPGGGSTEVVLPPDTSTSFEVGALRLTEAFLHHDPPVAEEIEALREHLRRVFDSLPRAAGRPVIAAGGTTTTLAAVSLGLERYDGRAVHGHQITRDEVEALAGRLSALTTTERERIPCVPPGRADVAPAGAHLLVELLRRLDVDQVIVTDRGLRFGLIEELLERRPV